MKRQFKELVSYICILGLSLMNIINSSISDIGKIISAFFVVIISCLMWTSIIEIKDL